MVIAKNEPFSVLKVNIWRCDNIGILVKKIAVSFWFFAVLFFNSSPFDRIINYLLQI